MYGVSRISSEEKVVLVSITDAKPSVLQETLAQLAGAGVVVDMISQSAPLGGNIRFSFTTSRQYFETVLQNIGGGDKEKSHVPMVSSGYSKINLYGEEMVTSVGVAARALAALAKESVEIALITTSDLDISLLVRQEDEDLAISSLKSVFLL